MSEVAERLIANFYRHPGTATASAFVLLHLTLGPFSDLRFQRSQSRVWTNLKLDGYPQRS